MNKQQVFEFEEYASADELTEADAGLLWEARRATIDAYAPYSGFHVGAAALLANGKIIKGTNQENASYPAGICAERTLLSAVGAVYPNEPVLAIAISYLNKKGGANDHPIAPCGICRQSLLEYEGRTDQPIRLILGGQLGKVYIIPGASSLLPFSFTGKDL